MGSKNLKDIERGIIFSFSATIETPKNGAGFKTDGKIDMSGEVTERGPSTKEIHRIIECTYVVYEGVDRKIKVEARRDADNAKIAEAILQIEDRMKHR